MGRNYFKWGWGVLVLVTPVRGNLTYRQVRVEGDKPQLQIAPQYKLPKAFHKDKLNQGDYADASSMTN